MPPGLGLSRLCRTRLPLVGEPVARRRCPGQSLAGEPVARRQRTALLAVLAAAMLLTVLLGAASPVSASEAWPLGAIGLPTAAGGSSHSGSGADGGGAGGVTGGGSHSGSGSSDASAVRIAIIDTGISAHAIDPARIAPGLNLVAPDSGTDDRIGHGTALAGILVGLKDQQTGILPGAALVPLVCVTLDAQDKPVNGGPDKLAQAVRTAIDRFHCPVILIGSGTTESPAALGDAIAYAESKGAVVVAPAGNENESSPSARFYPACYETVLGVAALRADGGIATFSQRQAVALAAPGADLLVATIRGRTVKAYGTSYAAAYVAGAAARLLTEYPGLSPAQVRTALLTSAQDIGAPGHDAESGAGRLNIQTALTAARPIAAANRQADNERLHRIALSVGLALAAFLAFLAGIIWHLRHLRRRQKRA